MKFSDNLHSFQCWTELIDLCQGELKFVDEVRVYFNSRRKLEEEFAESVKKLDAHHIKQSVNSGGYFSETWAHLLHESSNGAECMLEGGRTFENVIIPQLNQLSVNKKKSISDLVTLKNRLETQITIVGKDITKLQTSIEDFAKATETNKRKYEESNRDNSLEYQEKYKCKFVSNAKKLQEFNNDYVLLLNIAGMHESTFVEHVLPAWLDHHQETLDTHIVDMKRILRHSFEVYLHHEADYTKIMSSVYAKISKTDFDSVYAGFISEHLTCPKLEPNNYEFDVNLQSHTSLNLPAKQLLVNELTQGILSAKLDAHTRDLENIDLKHKDRMEKLKVIEAEDNEIKKLQAKAQIYELNAQRCRYQMTVNFIQENLSAWKDRPVEPFYNLLPVVVPLGDTVQPITPHCLGHISPNLVHKSSTFTRIKNLLSLKRSASTEMSPVTEADVIQGTPVSVKSFEDDEDYVVMTKEQEDEGNESDSTQSIEDYHCPKQLLEVDHPMPLPNQPWFHSDISRHDTEALLQYKGQFLVRKTIDSKRRTMVLVLSVNSGGFIKHFIMQINEKGQFRLEGEFFNSIQSLLNYHITTQKPITSRSLVIIRQPIIRDKWTLLHRDIRLKEFLGKGNFGDVYQAQLLPSNKEVAVKTCRDSNNEQFKNQFIEEAEVLKKFSHKNVVRLMGLCHDEAPFYIVMEFMNSGALLGYLKEGPLLPIKQLVHYCEQAAAGMSYLHQQNYIHRDLAARNCLIHDKTQLKISDFGMSRYQETNGVYISKMKQIPIRWTAPECLMFRTYTFKSDVWSYGVLMWEIFNKGLYPYGDMTNRDVKDQIDAGFRLTKHRDTPSEVYDLMLRCWRYEPKGRPSFNEIHETIKSIYIEHYLNTKRHSSSGGTTGGTPPPPSPKTKRHSNPASPHPLSPKSIKRLSNPMPGGLPSPNIPPQSPNIPPQSPNIPPQSPKIPPRSPMVRRSSTSTGQSSF